ncbi:MAG TPA: BON domain-containing protein [Verrucomicrobiae bacterium]|nr:BON domain-containing protein [Verrucomicrobiae bacterium]
MKIIILIIGIAIGATAVWFYRSQPQGSPARNTGEEIESAVRSAGSSLQERIGSLNLRGDDIRDELERTGKVIRRNASSAGDAIADATEDARTTAAIKAKLVRDPDLSAWDISVNTTAGVVTLAGSVANADHIGKAVALAMDTEHVKEVVSTLQVKAER